MPVKMEIGEYCTPVKLEGGEYCTASEPFVSDDVWKKFNWDFPEFPEFTGKKKPFT